MLTWTARFVNHRHQQHQQHQGVWEVKGEEHAIPVRGVVDQFVRWFLGGTFRPRTDENDWCRHIFGESNKAADTHANWLRTMVILVLERNGWRLISTIKCKKSRHIVLSFDGTRRESGLGAAAWILWLRDEYGTCEKVSYGGRVLRNASAMIAEREALRMGIEHLTVLFPTEVARLIFKMSAQIGQYSTSSMRSLCVSSVFTGM